jgi:hypothetical protein
MTGKAEPVITKKIAQQFLADGQAVDLNSFVAIEDAAAEILSTYADQQIRKVLTEVATQLDAQASEGNYDASGMYDLGACEEFDVLRRSLPLIDGFRRPRRGVPNGFCCAYGFDSKTAARLSAGATRPIRSGLAYFFIDDAYASSLADEDFKTIDSQWIHVELHGEWDDGPMKGWLAEASTPVGGSGIPATMPFSDETLEALEPLAADMMLELDGVTSISTAAAASLAKVCCDLSLCGIERLNESEADALAMHRYGSLMLGLTSMSDSAATALSRHNGTLILNGIEVLTEGVAKALAQHTGDLYLNAVTDLSDLAARYLSKHTGDMQLNSLQKLSAAAAESLSMHAGGLELDALATVPDEAVAYLAKHDSLTVSSELKSRLKEWRRKSRHGRT